MYAPSLPSRERGLKSQIITTFANIINVAPLAGAWIEIKVISIGKDIVKGRSPRGSVD